LLLSHLFCCNYKTLFCIKSSRNPGGCTRKMATFLFNSQLCTQAPIAESKRVKWARINLTITESNCLSIAIGARTEFAAKQYLTRPAKESSYFHETTIRLPLLLPFRTSSSNAHNWSFNKPGQVKTSGQDSLNHKDKWPWTACEIEEPS